MNRHPATRTATVNPAKEPTPPASKGLGALRASAALLAITCFAALGLGGCGSEEDAAGEAGEYIPVVGYLEFGSQCPYGSVSSPARVPAGLWDCPISLGEFRIKEAPKPLFLQADCRKKLVSMRTTDGGSDISWQTMPDGSFSVGLDQQEMVIEDDGSGVPGPCRVKARVEVSGTLKCNDRDRMDIPFDSVWWLHPETPASPSPSPIAMPSPVASAEPATTPPWYWPPGLPFFPMRENNGGEDAARAPSPAPLRECRLPKSCYLHAPHVIQQCE